MEDLTCEGRFLRHAEKDKQMSQFNHGNMNNDFPYLSLASLLYTHIS